MQIIVQKSDNVAVYMFGDSETIIITESGLIAPSFRAMDIRTETHAIVQDVPAPDPWVGGAWAWTGDTWHVVNQALIDAYLKPQVPTEITNWQAKKQLLIEGVYDQVNAAISTMDTAAQVDWNHAAIFKRHYPLIAQMQTFLGRTDAETDAYFIAASKLQ